MVGIQLGILNFFIYLSFILFISLIHAIICPYFKIDERMLTVLKIKNMMLI